MSLVKLAITNPTQLRLFQWMKNSANMGPSVAAKYDLVTNLAAQVKNSPNKRNALRAAVKDLKGAGLQKRNPATLAHNLKPTVTNVADVKPLNVPKELANAM